MTPEIIAALDHSAQAALLMRHHLCEAILDIWDITGDGPNIGDMLLLATEVMGDAYQDAEDARQGGNA